MNEMANSLAPQQPLEPLDISKMKKGTKALFRKKENSEEKFIPVRIFQTPDALDIRMGYVMVRYENNRNRQEKTSVENIFRRTGTAVAATV